MADGWKEAGIWIWNFLSEEIVGMIEFRNVTSADAKRLWDAMLKLDLETSFMMYEPGEREGNSSLHALEENILEAEKYGDFWLTAEDDGRIVGYIKAERGRFRRIAHSAYIVVGILSDYCGHGIGTEFFSRLGQWAKKEGIVRLELTVQCRNTAAVRLYEKCGFQIEGTKVKSMVVDGEFVDEYYMAKVMDYSAI